MERTFKTARSIFQGGLTMATLGSIYGVLVPVLAEAIKIAFFLSLSCAVGRIVIRAGTGKESFF